jgi:osmotically-inducible protein OsmY
MTIANLGTQDIQLRDDVMSELEWDSQVDASAIGVTARDGAVVLTGFIGTYAGKLAAERAAKRVKGVVAVANDIDVRLKLARTDADIAEDAAHALRLRGMPPGTIQAVVHSAQVTLTGRVRLLFQKWAAEKSVRHVAGVRQVINRISVEPQRTVRDVQHQIVKELHQHADIDARHIDVEVTGNTATLTGRVTTWFQRDAAERAAGNAPGISEVVNRIEVEPRHDSMAL